MPTSKRDASKAGRLMRTSKSKQVRSVAASDLAQAKRHPKRRGGGR
jgi:hypothetical protein